MKRTVIIAIMVLAGAVFVFIGLESRVRIAANTPVAGPPWIGYAFAGAGERSTSQKVEAGKTFADIAQSFGIGYEDMLAMLIAAKKTYNLEKIVEGKEVSAIVNETTGALDKFLYQIDSEEVLVAEKQESGWTAERAPIPYETKRAEIKGTIDSSLFAAVASAGGDDRVALALAEAFGWQVDFATDIRTGDSFKAIYEKRYLNGNYVAPGNILAARFINDGHEFKGVHFVSGDGTSGYYDLEGISLEKIFLKSPLSYRYISSGFSYNRLNPVTRSAWGPHRAIDYAADYGTPVVTVGAGTVISAGWNGELGNAVFVRHNDTYTTVYGHFSRVAVKKGQKVAQGQVVGYVGATGDATGPHLHFEIRKYGTRVNPLTIELPPGDPVPAADREKFQTSLAEFKDFFAD
jgi:murein DD-endopeptidase MepM/ murein hydrolase activator NlpD